MTDKATKLVPPNKASIEGIELFDITDGHDPVETANAELADIDWTPEQAATALNKSVRTIRRMLQDGTLKGYKVPGRRRDEWRVKAVSVSRKETVNVPVQKALVSENDRLWQLLREKDAKLEALTIRTGYLQAQLEASQETIKLLTDSQHKDGWWRRLCKWLVAGGH
jgi:excisionase family DNA binding protein